MNHLLTKTYNLDTIIQEVQTYLYDKLTDKWGSSCLDAYGRIYKNERDGSVIPEVYDSCDCDYKEVYYNDQSCLFFIDDDTHDSEDGIVFKSKVKIVFMLNLDDLKHSKERIDADVRHDVIQLLRKYEGVFKIENIEQTINTVLSGFKTDGIKFQDMQPYHVFAIKGTLNYYVNDKCN